MPQQEAINENTKRKLMKNAGLLTEAYNDNETEEYRNTRGENPHQPYNNAWHDYDERQTRAYGQSITNARDRNDARVKRQDAEAMAGRAATRAKQDAAEEPTNRPAERSAGDYYSNGPMRSPAEEWDILKKVPGRLWQDIQGSMGIGGPKKTDAEKRAEHARIDKTEKSKMKKMWSKNPKASTLSKLNKNALPQVASWIKRGKARLGLEEEMLKDRISKDLENVRIDENTKRTLMKRAGII